MEPEKLGCQKCEDELKRFTTLAYRSPEMVDMYSKQKITKSDIWVRGEGEEGRGDGMKVYCFSGWCKKRLSELCVCVCWWCDRQ